MKAYELNARYGKNGRNTCTLFVYENRDGSKWYAVEGSVNMNCTYDELSDGVDIETLNDFDTAGASMPIDNIEIMVNEVEA